MKRLGSVLVAALAAVALTGTMTPATAANATPGIVTKAEFSKVHKGMTRARVHKIFGTKGLLCRWGNYRVKGTPMQARVYRTKNTSPGRAHLLSGEGAGIGITYKKVNGVYRVDQKSASWTNYFW